MRLIFTIARCVMITGLGLASTGVLFCLIDGGTSSAEVPALLLALMAVLASGGVNGWESPRLAYVNLLASMASMLVKAQWLEYSLGGSLRVKWVLLVIAFAWVVRVVAGTEWRTGAGVAGVVLSPLLGVAAYLFEWPHLVLSCGVLVILFGCLSILDSRWEVFAVLLAIAYAFSSPILPYSQLTQHGFNVLSVTAGAFLCAGTKVRDHD